MKPNQSANQSPSSAPAHPDAYRDVIADLRRRGEQHNAAADDLERLAGLNAPPVTRPFKFRPSGRAKTLAKRVAKLKSRLTGSSGTSALVLTAMKAGADTLAAIAKDCKVKPSTARTALLALEDAGRVKRQCKSRATRYQLTNDK
jgi:uncharacterized protein YutE (UPF0331/DUF86 family)